MVERSLCMREAGGSMPMSSMVYLLNPILPTFLQRNGKSSASVYFCRISLVVEHRTCNAEVAGSIPAGGSGCDVRVVKEFDLKSNGLCPRRFKSCSQRSVILSELVKEPDC